MEKRFTHRRDKRRQRYGHQPRANFDHPVRPVFVAEALERRVLLSTTFLVTNTADSGAGSLRQAITSADKLKGSSVIKFQIGAGQQTISPLSQLPSLSSSITLSGNTQPGYAGTPLIVINGSQAGSASDGIVVTGGGCILRGLVIENFGANGIWLSGTGGTTVQGNYIGVSSTGSAAAGNGASGILVTSPGDLIGGPTAADRNVISGNLDQGINVYSATAVGDRIEGNYIGTNAAGSAAVANQVSGVCVYGGLTITIGGSAAGDGNLISGNVQDGIVILCGASGNVVAGNLIGTNAAGTSPLPNEFSGVEVDSNNNTVGGLTARARNIISANAVAGVVLWTSASFDNVVEGNYIGTDITGTYVVGAQTDGVDIDDGANDNTIGGHTASARNVISGSVNNGVGFFGAGTSGNVLEGNYIGTSASGLLGLGNGLLESGGLGPGVIADNGASGNLIGGPAAGAGNLISANGTGIILFGAAGTAPGNTVQGNRIGANSAGAGSLANVGDGILILGDDNLIGGTSAVDGNLIFGNTADAIIVGSGTGNIIEGNTVEA